MREIRTKILIVLHLILVVVAYTAWLWVDYRILLVVAALHLIMLELLHGCPLSHMQFPEDKNKRFYEWWLGKLGIDVTSSVARRRRIRIVMQYIVPVVLVLIAVGWQVLLWHQPFFGL